MPSWDLIGSFAWGHNLRLISYEKSLRSQCCWKWNILLEQQWVSFSFWLSWWYLFPRKYGLWHFWWYFPNYVPWDVSLKRCYEKWSSWSDKFPAHSCGHFGRSTLRVSSCKALRSLGVRKYLEKQCSLVWYFEVSNKQLFQVLEQVQSLRPILPYVLLRLTYVEMRWPLYPGEDYKQFSASVMECELCTFTFST